VSCITIVKHRNLLAGISGGHNHQRGIEDGIQIEDGGMAENKAQSRFPAFSKAWDQVLTHVNRGAFSMVTTLLPPF
jgi:hypothetical protein